MVVQKNGISLLLLSVAVPAQYNEEISFASEVKSLLFINAESAPENSSCHRKPSSVIMKTFSVLRLDWASTTNETERIMAVNRYLIILNLKDDSILIIHCQISRKLNTDYSLLSNLELIPDFTTCVSGTIC